MELLLYQTAICNRRASPAFVQFLSRGRMLEWQIHPGLFVFPSLRVVHLHQRATGFGKVFVPCIYMPTLLRQLAGWGAVMRYVVSRGVGSSSGCTSYDACVIVCSILLDQNVVCPKK